MLPHHHLNVFFEVVAEYVEESILNAMTGAETKVGQKGSTAYALLLDELNTIMEKYGRSTTS
jgi:L-aminopeptidase/D-esterase-like protein